MSDSSVPKDGFEGSFGDACRFFYGRIADDDENQKRDRAIFSAYLMLLESDEAELGDNCKERKTLIIPKGVEGNPLEKYEAGYFSINDKMYAFTVSNLVSVALENCYFFIKGICCRDWTQVTAGVVLTVFRTIVRIPDSDKCLLRALIENGFDKRESFILDDIQKILVSESSISFICNQEFKTIKCVNYSCGQCTCDFIKAAKDLVDLKILVPVGGREAPYSSLKMAR